MHICIIAQLHYRTGAPSCRLAAVARRRRSHRSGLQPAEFTALIPPDIIGTQTSVLPRRIAIGLPNGTRKTIGRLKRKRTWALPVTIITAAAARYLPGHRITELTNHLLPEPAANAISATVQRLNDADPTFVAIAVAGITYWAGKERIDRAVTELIIMAYKDIFRRARREVIAEAHDKGRTEGHSEGRTEGRTEGRHEMLQDLKAKAPPDIKAWLEQAGEQPPEC